MGSISYGFVTPPAVLILICVIGALLAPVWRGLGIGLVLIASIALYALATPALSSYLLRQAESGLPRNPDLSEAQAIVVLGGDARPGDGRDNPDRLGPLSMQRLAYAAAAYRQLKLPIAVSGGRVPPMHTSEAELMQQVLAQDFGIPVTWVEDASGTTYENADNTARLLRIKQIGAVVVVTQAWHLPRAVRSFRRTGVKALPWPAPRTALRTERIDDFLPNVAALYDSQHALHELLGDAFYDLRYD